MSDQVDENKYIEYWNNINTKIQLIDNIILYLINLE